MLPLRSCALPVALPDDWPVIGEGGGARPATFSLSEGSSGQSVEAMLGKRQREVVEALRKRGDDSERTLSEWSPVVGPRAS